MSHWSRLLTWKGPGTKPQSSKSFKRFQKILPLLASINWPSLVGSWVGVQKIYWEVHPFSCTNNHHDVTNLLNHGMVKDPKTWISWGRNIIFLRNKKILNLSLRWHILRSYRFVVEVTFKYHNTFRNVFTTSVINLP